LLGRSGAFEPYPSDVGPLLEVGELLVANGEGRGAGAQRVEHLDHVEVFVHLLLRQVADGTLALNLGNLNV
jgi:hypothetical protein